jgi:prophage regulatory protein
MLIIYPELKTKKGIPFCRDHLRRLWKKGKFPRPVDVGPGRLAWVEEEIDAHIAEIVAKRDRQEPPEGKTAELAKPSPAVAERSTATERRGASRKKASSGQRS